jgi:hypothetical protein
VVTREEPHHAMSKPSQDDIIAENTRLTADLTVAQGEVTRL